MLTRVVVSKALLYDLLINGVRLEVCGCSKPLLKQLLHTVPADRYEDIVFIFSDGVEETKYLPSTSQRIRYNCERSSNNANQ